MRPRRGDIEDRVDLFIIIPVARDADADVGLVLVVGIDHLDQLSLDLAAVVATALGTAATGPLPVASA
jgi:hypothetical protein